MFDWNDLNIIRQLRDVKATLAQMRVELAGLRTLFMSVKADLDALTQKIDDATNEVAARLDRISGQIKNSMTDQEVADLKAKLSAESDRLTTLGSDPANPVPPEPPTP